jgi:hypothetical protein
MMHELRPFDAALDVDHSILLVEREHFVHVRHVDHRRVGCELLSAHCVTSACDADGTATAFAHDRPQLLDRLRSDDSRDARPVQLRVDVIDPLPGLTLARRDARGRVKRGKAGRL